MVRLTMSAGRVHGIRPNDVVGRHCLSRQHPRPHHRRHPHPGGRTLVDVPQQYVTQVLAKGADEASLMFAKFSPDGRAVAYLRHNNIYVESLEDDAILDGAITQLTDDGAEHCINGTADWLYEEEFGLRDAFCWSPSGRFVAYWQFDTTGIDTFYLINNTDSLYPTLTPIPYPKAGTTNPAARIGVVSVAGGPTTWFDLPGDPRQHYIPKMEWIKTKGDADEAVVIQQLNRLQNRNHVFLGRAAGGTVQTILVEEDETWLYVRDQRLEWLDGGRAFLWFSERDGWRHLYRVALDGSEPALLTPGDYDVITLQAVVEPADGQPGWVYFIASPEEPARRYLYRVPLEGGPAERITPADQPGWHNYDIAPDGRWAFHTSHTMARPPAIDFIRLPGHETVRPAESNRALHEKIAALDIRPPEFFRVDIGDDVILDGWCLKPPAFDPGRRYPVLFYVYGEPAEATVVDAWTGDRYLWHQLLAQMGYVVISVDNRGTPAPKGRAWRKCVYRQVGILSSDEQAAAARALLAERPYLDPGRVGVWGWSGGGSMTLMLMFKYPGAVPGGHRHRRRQPPEILRYRLPGALHGPAPGQRGRLPRRLTPDPRRELAGRSVDHPRHGGRQRPLPGLRGAGQRANPPQQAVQHDGLPRPQPCHQRRRRHQPPSLRPDDPLPLRPPLAYFFRSHTPTRSGRIVSSIAASSSRSSASISTSSRACSAK
jgi:dipeptidyl-peptidase 4